MEHGATILVVDDVPANIDAIAGQLRSDFRVKAATNGERALTIAGQGDHLDVILLDVMMPGMDGFEVCRRLKADELSCDIPVVMVTALGDVDSRVKALEAGADDFLTKPVEAVELLARVRSLAKVRAYHEQRRRYAQELEKAVEQRTAQLVAARRQLEQDYVHTVMLGFDLFHMFDDYLGAHCRRVARYVQIAGERLGLDGQQLKDLELAATLHDVGLVGLKRSELIDVFSDKQVFPDLVLQYQQHPMEAVALLARLERYAVISSIIATHHEAHDGSGFPRKIKGDEIPLESRILAVADRYDTLCRMSEFRRTPDDAIVLISRTEADRFHPDVLEAFVEAIADNDPFAVQIEMDVSRLATGMVLSKPIRTRNEIVLLSGGTLLNDEHIGILERYARREALVLPIYVYEESEPDA